MGGAHMQVVIALLLGVRRNWHIFLGIILVRINKQLESDNIFEKFKKSLDIVIDA